MLRRVQLSSKNIFNTCKSLKKINLTSSPLNTKLTYLQPCIQPLLSRNILTVNTIMDTLKTPTLIQPPTDTSVQNVLLNFSLNTEQITQLGNELLEKSKQILDQVAAVPASEANFETVIKPLAQIEAYRSIFSASSYFPQYISTSSEVRKASADVTQNLEAFEIESRMRKDLYTSVQNAIKNIEVSALSPEDQRFIEKLQLDFKRNGLDLADDKLEKLKEILKKISENSIKFSLAIAEDKTTVELTEAELEGVPKDFLEGLPKKKSDTTGEEVFVVGMKPSEL
jgi:Zn-dependent oligopeptidase